MSTPAPFYTQSPADVTRRFEVDPAKGLTSWEAEARLKRHGPNQLRKSETRSGRKILAAQFQSVVIWILVVAAVLAFLYGRRAEALAVWAVILVNTSIGFITEWKAVRSMEALRKMGAGSCRVRRNGKEEEKSVDTLVPGDIVRVEGGDTVPADLRLLDARHLRVNEAALTGESVPASKRTDAVDSQTPLADRTCMLYKGTSLAEGRGEGVVVSTGMHTELGGISELVAKTEQRNAPLHVQMNQLGGRLAWITLGIAAGIAVAGLVAGHPLAVMVETAIALGVAAIPEGLPVVATLALARGMWRMSRRNVLINRLSAVETLGSTRIIFTDKTGTLTENRMKVRILATPSGSPEIDQTRTLPDTLDPHISRAVEIGVLCNNADLREEDGIENPLGDPTEVALLRTGKQWNLHRAERLESKPEVREVSFDPDVMKMATYHQTSDGIEVAVKGAVRAVLEGCTRLAGGDDGKDTDLSDVLRKKWTEKAAHMAESGLRVLAVADKTTQSKEDEPYDHLRLVGLLGLLDPPRQEVAESIQACRKAGIHVVMVTGDQPETALSIARKCGLIHESDHEKRVMVGREIEHLEDPDRDLRDRILATSVFSRVSPEQKLYLMRIFQDEGHTVAMTGDGVNDTPALKKADIGIAMGQRGSDAARQVADMVLKDDAFSSIVAAVAQGRVIFGNIRKSVLFMLCTNLAEVLAVAAASFSGMPLPLLPLQILYLNVLTDVFPALALGVGRGGDRVMQRKPRARDEGILETPQWRAIAGWSTVISLCVLAALAYGLRGLALDTPAAVTLSFLTLGFAKLGFVFNLREIHSGLLDNDIVKNPWIWFSLWLCALLLLASVYVPMLSGILDTRPPTPAGWRTVAFLSLLPLILGQIRLWRQGNTK